MSLCPNCFFDLDKKEAADDDSPAAALASEATSAETSHPEPASAKSDSPAEDSSGKVDPTSPPATKAGESNAGPKKPRLSWDQTFRQIRKGKRV